MKENNRKNNLGTNKPIKSLGIYRINKENSKHLIIYMKGPNNSLYKKGVFRKI